MKDKNNLDIGRMSIDIFLSAEQVTANTIIIPKLLHGSNIVTVVSGNEDLNDCDALITENGGLSLGIRTADCAPVCFSDGKTTGIAHVGWRGLCLGLIEKMLPHFNAGALSVYVGPFLHSFQIQRDFCYEKINHKFGERFLSQEGDNLMFNFRDAIASLLPTQTVYDSRNTATDFSFPSHRRGDANRLITVVSFHL